MGNRRCVEIVTVVVGLDQAVAAAVRLVSHEITACAAPPFRPVERVIGAIHDYAVVNVHCATEEFQTVIRTVASLHVGNLCAVTHAIEGDAIGFVFLIESETGIFQAYILQDAGIVAGVAATVCGITDFRKPCATLRVDGRTSTDVQAAPGTHRLVFSCHHDGRLCRALRVNLRTLLNQNVVHLTVIVGCDGHACRDGQLGRSLHLQRAAQRVGLAGFQRQVGSHVAAQSVRSRIQPVLYTSCGHAGCVVVIVTSREGRHGCTQYHRPSGVSQKICFHLLSRFKGFELNDLFFYVFTMYRSRRDSRPHLH